MKISKIFSAVAVGMLALLAASCEGEKELIIIEGNLPIKTTSLYMVGDATPVGWNIGAPEPFTPTEEDALVFTWKGNLNGGELKLCLAAGSWDNPFIRPTEAGTPITKEPIVDAPFAMHAGDPDDKWVVLDAGVYSLKFDLRNWTMSTTYLGEAEAKPAEPIESEVMYLVGNATSAGWNIDDPMPLTKTAPFIFEYEGKLKAGEMKGYIETGNWNADAIRPKTADVKINKNGVEDEDFTFAASPDNKWVVEEEGIYQLKFDLENWKISATYVGEAPYEDPLLSATAVYFIGDATSGGWGWDNCIVMEPTAVPHEFTWTGVLALGNLKGSVEKDGSYACPFIRPESPDVTIDSNGVAAPNFVFTTDPEDYKWLVTEAGTYTLTVNLEKFTISAVMDGKAPEPTNDPIDTEVFYIIGDATSAGWNIGSPLALTKTGDYTFVYEGELYADGELKACTSAGSWDVPFVRPQVENSPITKAGVAGETFVYTTGPDHKWKVMDGGNYKLTFDLKNYTLTAEYTGDFVIDKTPIVTNVVYMIGDATPNGWSMDNPTPFTQDATNSFIFTWTGDLKTGQLKACIEKDSSYSCPFIRPSSAAVEISDKGVAASDFVFTRKPDDQWVVTKAGNYTLTLDLENYTIQATYND